MYNSREAVPETNKFMPDTTQKNTSSPSEKSDGLNLEWSYAGKAMRAQTFLFVLISLLAVGGGVYAMSAALLGSSYRLVWCLIAGGLALLWGYHYAVYFYRTWTIRYRLTDQRLYVHLGLLTRTSDSMELIYIDDVRLVQTLTDRFINGGVGSLIIFCSADKTDKKLVLKGIDKPQEIFEKIDATRTVLRAKRSILTGT